MKSVHHLVRIEKGFENAETLAELPMTDLEAKKMNDNLEKKGHRLVRWVKVA